MACPNQDDRRRVARALAMDLPRTASWEEITAAEHERLVDCQIPGLPSSSTQAQIEAVWEALRGEAAEALGLPPGSSWDEIDEEKQRRDAALDKDENEGEDDE